MSDFALVLSVTLHTTHQPVSSAVAVRCWLALRRTVWSMALGHVVSLPCNVLRRLGLELESQDWSQVRLSDHCTTEVDTVIQPVVPVICIPGIIGIFFFRIGSHIVLLSTLCLLMGLLASAMCTRVCHQSQNQMKQRYSLAL